MTTVWIITAALAVLLMVRLRFWYREGQKLLRESYLPPKPSFVGQFLLKTVSRIMCFLFVGRVKVMNRKNAYYKGRLNILPNHQFELDFMVVAKALPYGFRHLGTKGQMNSPAKATLAALAGFFAVDTEGGKAQGKGKGQMAVEACGRVISLQNKSRLVMFPQGMLIRDNVQRPEEYRTGAIRALIHARDELGVEESDLAVLPMAVKYVRDPAQASWFHKLVNAIGFKKFRKFRMHDVTTTNYGAIVNIGKVIPLKDLPADPREATEAVRVVIQALLDEIEVAHG